MTRSSAMIRRFVALGAVLAVVGAAGCKSAPKKEGEDIAPINAINADIPTTGDSDSGKAMGMQTVHFPYDSFAIEGEAKTTLNGNAEVLKGNSTIRVQIEGHCDQRGGIQYNIALGEKRANALKKYLEGQGIASDRITTISFGKERPIDPGTTEDAYGKNRRGNFVITSK
ncbi:MAG: OmpA family protein [Bdellovibrionota bacterium]